MRPPDLTGVARAWHIKPGKEAKQRHVEEWGYPDSSLTTWIVNGPYHPIWAWWHIGVVHLRDVPGAPPPHKQYPEAEFELTIYSLEAGPALDRKEIDVDALERGAHKKLGVLQPADLVFHFHGVTDKQAARIGDLVVEHVVAGRSCDSDFREEWKASLARTVEHFVLGVHK